MEEHVNQSKTPIFIIGVHRSGTTLLRYMLNSHPNIFIPPESDFIPRFFLDDPAAKLTFKEINVLLKKIFTEYRFVREWKNAPPSVEDFSGFELTPSTFLSRLYELYAQQYGAHRWGDKTPIYSSYVDLLDKLFPTAQFIHIIRDGRDVALSMLEKWGNKEFHIDIYYAARNWIRRIRQARLCGSRLGGDRYLEIKYESLVSEPGDQLKKICNFLGEEYYPVMSQPQLLGKQTIEPGSFHDQVRNPPSRDRIQRWKRELPEEDLNIFEYIAGDLLLELGYPKQNPDSIKLDGLEYIRYLLLAGKYSILQSVRSIFQAFRLMPPI